MAPPLQQPLTGGADATKAQLRALEWRLVGSNLANQLGSKAWEFVVPLLLVRLSGGRLVAPAVLGIVTTAAEFLLGPAAGRWNDRAPSRLGVVLCGASAQAAAVLGTVGCLVLAGELGSAGEVGGDLAGVGSVQEDPTWFSGTRPWLGGGLFAAFCLCGVVEVLGRLVSKVSVERDWVPTAIEPFGEAAMARVNARMANVDLVGEIIGPLLAGCAVAAAPSISMGFGIVAVLDVASFLPHLVLLADVQARCPALRAPRVEDSSLRPQEEGQAAAPGGAEEVAFANMGAWMTFFTHPSGVAILSISYALVFFTVLSSHDVVLTAYLAQIGVHPAALAAFRAAGAAAGVCGACSFERAAEHGDAKRVAGLYIGGQAVAVFVAAGALALRVGGPHGGLSQNWQLAPFLAAIVASRVGLYGFDVGFTTLSQGLVDERHRGAVGAVTNSLCAFMQLCMYVATSGSTGRSGAEGFVPLVWASAFAVGAAALTFGLWSQCYHEHEHFHGAVAEQGRGHEHGHSHNHDCGHSHGVAQVHLHEHTVQQARSLHPVRDGVWKHSHVHYDGPRFTRRRSEAAPVRS